MAGSPTLPDQGGRGWESVIQETKFRLPHHFELKRSKYWGQRPGIGGLQRRSRPVCGSCIQQGNPERCLGLEGERSVPFRPLLIN